MGVTFVFETPTAGDAEQLAALKADTFSDAFAADNDPAELAAHVERAFCVEAVRAQLSDPNSDTTWVLDGTQPVGYMKSNSGPAQTVTGMEDGLELEQLYVRRSHQGLGLGGRLVDLAVEAARRESRDFLWLGVWERNERAISMYRHRGFRAFGDHLFMFGGDPQTDLLMRLDLD
jgi:ribosomal protein S18 acetylase RimI-like enzyme